MIEADEVVLCDFGGTMLDADGVGYCSDITRCVWTGPIPERAAEIYDVLLRAQRRSVDSAVLGATCESVDAAARSVIAEGGYGEFFVHRTGHGIGVEAHEDPYIVEGNTAPLVQGHAFSVEPGIYLPGDLGFRLEDIVVAAVDGPESLNRVEHSLVSVEA